MVGNKSISAGVIVTNGENFLICHPTNSKWWDLPKGNIDQGETAGQAAVRELDEETGIKASESDLEFLGFFSYKPKKDLALFRLTVTNMPDASKLKCESTFRSGMRYIPEMDKFAIVDRTKMLTMVNPSLNKVLSGLI